VVKSRPLRYRLRRLDNRSLAFYVTKYYFWFSTTGTGSSNTESTKPGNRTTKDYHSKISGREKLKLPKGCNQWETTRAEK
jgi:hypothetical protein